MKAAAGDEASAVPHHAARIEDVDETTDATHHVARTETAVVLKTKRAEPRLVTRDRSCTHESGGGG